MKIFLFLLSLSSTWLLANPRLEQHQKASEKLKNLHFFYQGKGMIVSPDIIKFYGLYRKIYPQINSSAPFHQRWGLNIHENEIVGLFQEKYSNMDIGVLGCIACHSGKAAGEFIVGLGNKNIDVGQIGKDAYLVQKVWSLYPGELRSKDFRSIHKQALSFTKKLSDPQITNLSQGLVSTALIRRWFYDVQDQPFPKNFKRGQVKVPHLWSYGEKRKSGSFWDGEGKGVLPGWAVAVELFAGQTPENVRAYEDKIHKAEDVLGELLPPKYPFALNQQKAKAGQNLFAQHCMKCHGDYQQDAYNLPIYQQTKAIPQRVVKTDPDRLNSLTDELYRLIEINPLSDLIQFQKQPEKSYVAPRLEGIWARFPYLHNASVPTLYHLMSSPESRPKIFSLKEAGERHRFDQNQVGLTTQITDENLLLKKAQKGDRSIYWTGRDGHSNEGHWFEFMKKLSEEEKFQIIEYLKTL